MKVLETIIIKSIKKAISLSGNTSTTDEVKAEEETDINSILKKCRQEAQQANESGIMPSSKYFQQAAVLSRKEKNYENEIAICKYYINLVSQYATNNNSSEVDLGNEVDTKIDPFNKRIHLAETMLYK